MAEPEILPGEAAVAADAGKPHEEQQHQEEEEEKEESPSSENSSTPDPEAFVNNGLEKWLAAREAWCRKPESSSNSKEMKGGRRAVPIDVDGVIDVLFDPRWRGGGPLGGRVKASLEPPRFPKNVPLPQMIDVLTDLWEAEGLDV